MNEIIFESSGNIEHFTDPEILQEESIVDNVEKIEEDLKEETVEDQEEEIEEDPEEEIEEDPEEEEETKNEDREVQYVYIKSDPVYISNDPIDNNNIEVVSVNSTVVSQNIIDTPLNEYDITDSLIVYMIVMFMGVGIIWLIKRSIFKWS